MYLQLPDVNNDVIRGCWSFIDQLFTRSHMVCIFLIFRDPVCVLTTDVKNHLLELCIWRGICCHMMGRKYLSQWHYHLLHVYTILLQCIYKKIQVFLIVAFQGGSFQAMNVSCNAFNARELFLQSWDQVTYLSPRSLSVNLVPRVLSMTMLVRSNFEKWRRPLGQVFSRSSIMPRTCFFILLWTLDAASVICYLWLSTIPSAMNRGHTTGPLR